MIIGLFALALTWLSVAALIAAAMLGEHDAVPYLVAAALVSLVLFLIAYRRSTR